MMNGMYSMMGPLMAWMMGYWLVFFVLVVVVLALVAVWLFQQLRRAPERGGTHPPTTPA